METIVFPDAASLVANHLETELDVETGTVLPDPVPDYFVRVRRTGGIRATIVSDAAQLTIETYADLHDSAHDLMTDARAALHALVGTDLDTATVYRVEELAGPADFPDPLSNQARYSMTVVVHLRGAVSAIGS